MHVYYQNGLALHNIIIYLYFDIDDLQNETGTFVSEFLILPFRFSIPDLTATVTSGWPASRSCSGRATDSRATTAPSRG